MFTSEGKPCNIEAVEVALESPTFFLNAGFPFIAAASASF
jgi:hypothetical protein